MRHVRGDPMRNVIWQSWVEPIDQGAYAVIARAEETWHGGVYSASTMLLVEMGVRSWIAHKQALEKLRNEMTRGIHLGGVVRQGITFAVGPHRFGMPLRGWVRDLRR